MRWPWARDDAVDGERQARRDWALARIEKLVGEMKVTVGQLQAIEAEQARRASDG